MLYNKLDSPPRKQVLCILSSMGAGGAETFLMKMLRNLGSAPYLFDFCLSVQQESFYEHEIMQLGGRIFHTVPRSKAPVKRYRQISMLVRDEKYQCVMVCNQYELAVLDLLAAKAGGATTLVYRANSTAIASGGCAKEWIHVALRAAAMCVPNILLAPSEDAANFVFGKAPVRKGRVTFIHNGIDESIYRFDPEKRCRVRAELRLEGKTVLVHVGRFSREKNHEFLIDAFAQATSQRRDLHLLLVGNGPDFEARRMQAESLDIADRISFLGVRSDVPSILQAADAILLPSLYEGMPNAVIEAQGAGLTCMVSDTITQEVDITGRVRRIPLDKDAWVREIISVKEDPNRRAMTWEVIDSGYEIHSVTERFVQTVFGGGLSDAD